LEYAEALRRAAAHCNIQQEYVDVWGRRVAPSEGCLRLILGSLGIPTGSAEEIERYLQAETSVEWSRPLDPSIVVREDAEYVPLRIPAERAGGSIKLEFEWEGGELQHRWFWLPETPELRRATVEGAEFIEKKLVLPRPLRLGYHRLRVYWMTHPELEVFSEARFIVCPERAHGIDRRIAGLAVCLFGLRSTRNWGIGDITDLKALIDVFAPAGAEFIALNPLHAIANRQPFNSSPYSPLTLLYRNFIYIDVERVPGYRHDTSLCEEIQKLRKMEFVEYERVAAAKMNALGTAFDYFLMGGGGPEFDTYLHLEGETLDRWAIYCALDEAMLQRDANVWVWAQWPSEYQTPHSPAVEEFASQHSNRVLFFKFLQWQLDVQLADAQAHALNCGMSVGLYHDFALATDRYGADLWARRDFFVPGCRVGAPPDVFAPNGQDWGFPPPNSKAHRASGYELFAQVIRHCARHGGALRLDHVMRFFRLYWIPEGLEIADGAYVRDRAEDWLGILALESVRNRFIVIGEDLGTVEEEIRHALADEEILGYRLLWFERNGTGFRQPSEYPPHTAVSTTTHDLPTPAGFFEGVDIEARREAGLVDEAAYRDQRANRETEASLLREALAQAGFEKDPLGFVLSTPCGVGIVNQEDLTGETHQQNLPASTWQYPNWRRKMNVALEDMGPLAQVFRAKVQQAGRAS
jgi:4-alpha-glucanotransferase